MPKEGDKATDGKTDAPAANPAKTSSAMSDGGQAAAATTAADPRATAGEAAGPGAETAGAKAGGSAGSPGAGTRSDAISLLKQDHRKVEALFKQYESADEAAKADLIEQICQALIIHTMLEESIFYPAALSEATEDQLDEAQVEHDSAKVLIRDLLAGEDEYQDAKVKVLREQISAHVQEEEAPDGVFAKAQKAGVNTADLGARLQQYKQQLTNRAERGALPDPQLVALRPHDTQPEQEQKMANNQSYNRERDDHGRFTSDDDDRGRSYSARGGGSRDRDDRGRFTSDDDDDRSRSYSARGGGANGNGSRDRDDRGRFTGDDDERGGGSYGAGNRDRDERGRFTDDHDRGYRSRGRDDGGDRDGRSGGSRRQGGWFGDSEGHSRAASQGWDELGGGRYARSYRDDDDGRGYRSRERDDDRDYRSSSSRDRGRGGWFGDSEGHSRASREGWDERGDGRREGRSFSSRDDDDRMARPRGRDDDRDYRSSSSRDRSQGGWFGDPEGHSEASRRGWEERGGSGGGRYAGSARNDDDDDRGSRSRGGGGRSSSSRGQGGWFGDSEGHAEAARRGWEDRR